MSVGGVTEAQFVPLVRAVAGDDLVAEEASERFARAAWTAVAEPGDRDAGTLIAVLGAVRAWQLVVDGVDAETLTRELVERSAGEIEVDADSWADALKRWQPRSDPAAVLLALRQAGRFGMRLLVPDDDAWPDRLDDLQTHAPFALWARGDVGRLATL